MIVQVSVYIPVCIFLAYIPAYIYLCENTHKRCLYLSNEYICVCKCDYTCA